MAALLDDHGSGTTAAVITAPPRATAADVPWENPATSPHSYREVHISIVALGRSSSCVEQVLAAAPTSVVVGDTRIALRFTAGVEALSRWRDYAFHRRRLGLFVLMEDFSAEAETELANLRHAHTDVLEMRVLSIGDQGPRPNLPIVALPCYRSPGFREALTVVVAEFAAGIVAVLELMVRQKLRERQV